ncbi:MAG: twin-arginine translocase TatA/TatE family subunit [Verrucomicrobiota bacterium]|nr:twin-arginine translocase TatA/TatE family subunit [Verrucomicrobiota bacterium]
MTHLASFMNLAGPDMIIILLIALVLFGAKRLPELAKGMGQAMKEFQKAKSDFSQEIHSPASPERPRDGQSVVIAPSDSAAHPPV